MKVLAPLNHPEALDNLVRAGADELYFGFHDDEWNDRFGQYADINRMSGFGKRANGCGFNDALGLIEKICGKGAVPFLTLNANGYSEAQLEYISGRYLPQLSRSGIGGVIVSDELTAAVAMEAGINAVASTMCGIYNADIARYYFEKGIRRMILPRDLSLDELSAITEQLPGVSFETFLMRNGCVFSDAYCLGMHQPQYPAVCTALKMAKQHTWVTGKSFRTDHDIALNNVLYNRYYHRSACGLCAIYRMKTMGIESLKIVGRADQTDRICDDIRMTKRNIWIAESSRDQETYLSRMIMPTDQTVRCLLGLSCYYPEIRQG